MGEGERRRRFVLVFNPEEAKKDKATTERALQRVEEEIRALADKPRKAHKKAVSAVLSHRTMGRLIKQSKRGRLRINWAELRQEEALDGKYLLSTSDDTLSSEDVALSFVRSIIARTKGSNLMCFSVIWHSFLCGFVSGRPRRAGTASGRLRRDAIWGNFLQKMAVFSCGQS